MHREGKEHRPENRQRAPTKEGLKLFRYPLGSHRRSFRCAFHCRAAHGGYDVLGRCTLVAGKVFGLYFPETLRGGAVPQHRLGAGGSQTFYSLLIPVGVRTLSGPLVRRSSLQSGAQQACDSSRRSSLQWRTQKARGLIPSRDAREGSDTPGRREPKECEEGRAEVLGTFSA